jgi:hypothetical protein
VEALKLFLNLEDRGIGMEAQGDRLRVFGPSGKPVLTAYETASIKRWKYHLLALVAYRPPEALQ